MRKAIAIDFDGVIHKYSAGWNDGSIYDKPIKGVHGAIMGLLENYCVFIHTTRDVKQVVEWMNTSFWDALGKNSEMGFLTIPMPEGTLFWDEWHKVAVTNRKLPAVAYIDDKGVRFNGNWGETLKELEELLNE